MKYVYANTLMYIDKFIIARNEHLCKERVNSNRYLEIRREGDKLEGKF